MNVLNVTNHGVFQMHIIILYGYLSHFYLVQRKVVDSLSYAHNAILGSQIEHLLTKYRNSMYIT